MIITTLSSNKRTLSTVGSTRALFFLGGCVGSPPELVPSPAPGAVPDRSTVNCVFLHSSSTLYFYKSGKAALHKLYPVELWRVEVAFGSVDKMSQFCINTQHDILTLLFVLFGFPAKEIQNL